MDESIKKEVTDLVNELRICLSVRDRKGRDPLFVQNASMLMRDCHDKLRYSVLMAYPDEEFCGAMNTDFAWILHRAGQTTKEGMSDDSESLLEIIRILTRIANIGLVGHFRDKTFRLPFMINEVTRWLKEREQVFRQISKLKPPTFI